MVKINSSFFCFVSTSKYFHCLILIERWHNIKNTDKNDRNVSNIVVTKISLEIELEKKGRGEEIRI